jgi:OOP family OmpA-OmpF porin
MKQIISILSLVIASLSLNANVVESEFKYIQPIAVEEAPVAKVVKKIVVKPKEQKQVKKLKAIKGVKTTEEICDTDSDGDGVVDTKDLCPDTSKEFRVDGDGCPQTSTLKVHFKTKKYNIQEKYIEDLNIFAKFLEDNPGYDVIIHGHTDNVGTNEDNRILSQNRANSVKEALVNYGIEEIRLTTVGEGEESPTTTNSTAHGRAANRRIEVELIK